VPPVSFIWKTVKNRHPFVRCGGIPSGAVATRTRCETVVECL
jgi:hypothetical protein